MINDVERGSVMLSRVSLRADYTQGTFSLDIVFTQAK